MNYRTSFQCPTTGQTVVASYAFGRLTVRAIDDDDVASELTEETKTETHAWVAQHTSKRFSSLDAANEYLIKASDGQTFGFDRD